MAYRLISLLAIATPALALSSHSPIDLEAYPAYTISLNQENPVLNETLSDLLHETLEAPPNSLPEKRHFLRTPSGQGFLCTVPSVTIASKKRAQAQAELDESSRQLQRQKGLERGLALLEPMRGGCIYMKQNWFTYSFCYGSEIRQFHEVRIAGSPAPKEDPNAEAYVLGHAPEPSMYNSNPKYGSGSHEVAKKEAWIPSRLGGVEGMGLDESGRYLSQVWEGGTVCDKTGMPRSVEVQFHCNTQTIDRIALIRETSICRYVLLIHTPRLCAEPLFLEGADKSLEPPSNIECQPVVSKFHESISHGDPSTASIESLDGGEGLNEPMPLQNLVIQPPAQAQGVDSSLPTDDQHSASTLSTDSVEQDHVETALLMTYNPETGEIESVESTILDLVEKGKQDQQELRRRVFGNGQDETLQREGQGNAEGQEGPKATITVDQLEEMVKMMADSLANAMKDATRQGERSDSRESAQDSEASNPSNRDQVVSILKELWGQDTAAQLGQAQQARGDEGNLIKNLLKKTRGSNKNEAFEQMKRGFGRRYDLADDEDEDDPRRPRDEL